MSGLTEADQDFSAVLADSGALAR